MQDKATTRTQHVFSNLKWSTFNAVISTLLPFVIRTLLIDRIGRDYTGVSNLFSSILQVLNIADFGIESAITYYLYKPLADGDYDTVVYLTRLVRKIYLIIGIIIFSAGVILIPFLPYFVKDQAYPDGLNLYAVYLVYVVDSAWAYLTTGYRSTLLRADQHLDLVSRAGCISASCMYVIQIISLLTIRNYYVYVVLLLIGPVLNSCMLYFFSNRRYRPLLSNADPEKSHLKNSDIFKTGMKSRMISVGFAKLRNVSRNSFDSIVISSFLGLTLLVKYQNYYQIMLVPITLLGIFHNSMAPSFGNSIATESREMNYQILKTYSFAECIFACICVSCLLNLYQPFITLWLGEDYLLPYNIVIIFAVYFYLMCVSDINVVLKETTGIWKQERVIAVVEAAANLILNVFLVRRFGVAGVLAATIVTLALINIPFEFSYLFRKYFKKYGLQYFLLELKYGATVLLICFISQRICSFVPAGGIGNLLLSLVLSVTIPAGLFCLLYGRDVEMKNLRQLVKTAGKR